MMFQGRFIRRVVILTGAGISAESGLSTFRDADGLWEQHDPMEIATPEAFARDPALVYRFYNARRKQLASVQPNAAHLALAQLQQAPGAEVFLVTQNVDDLHERAGSEQVCHMHGELQSMRCQACDSVLPALVSYDAASICTHCNTRGKLRPDIVWFGEMPYHMDLIDLKLADCDLFVAVGTSGVVYPAAGFVRQAGIQGATTLEINKEISEVSNHFQLHRQGPATSEVTALVRELLAG